MHWNRLVTPKKGAESAGADSVELFSFGEVVGFVTGDTGDGCSLEWLFVDEVSATSKSIVGGLAEEAAVFDFSVLDLLLHMGLGLGDGSGKVEDCCFLAFAVWSAEVPPNFVFLEDDGVSHKGLLLQGTGAAYIADGRFAAEEDGDDLT